MRDAEDPKIDENLVQHRGAGKVGLVVVGWRGAYVRIAEYSGLNATSPLDVVAAARHDR
jgi:hypothetical protein